MKSFVLGSLIVLAAALPVSAQGVHFGITGGWYTPYGAVKDYAKSGYDGGLTLQIGAPLVPVGFRFDAMYGEMPGKSLYVAGETVKSDFTVWSATGNIVWTIFGNALPTKFYLIGGIGYYSVQQKITSTLGSVPTVTTPAFGYNAGLGFKFTKLFIEARWTNINGGLNLEAFGSTGSQALQVVPINVGILF